MAKRKSKGTGRDYTDSRRFWRTAWQKAEAQGPQEQQGQQGVVAQNAESGRLRFLKPPALLVRKVGPKDCGSPPPCRQVSCRRAHSDGAASVGSNDRNVNAEVLRGFHSGLSTDAVDEVAAEATRYGRAGQRFSGRAHPARVRLGAAAPLREGREPFSSEVPRPSL